MENILCLALQRVHIIFFACFAHILQSHLSEQILPTPLAMLFTNRLDQFYSDACTYYVSSLLNAIRAHTRRACGRTSQSTAMSVSCNYESSEHIRYNRDGQMRPPGPLAALAIELAAPTA